MSLPMFALFGIIAIAWATVIRGLRRCRSRPNDLATWISWGGFLTLAVTLSAPLPRVTALVDRLAGTRGVADFLEHAAALLTGLFWLAYLVRLNGLSSRDTSRLFRLAGLVAAALLVMSARFALAPGRIEYRLGPHPDLAALYMAFYRFVYRGVFAVELLQALALLRQYAAVAMRRPPLRARLRLLSWLLVFTIVYISYECLTVLIQPLPSLHSRLLELRAILILLALVAPSSWYARWLHVWGRWVAWRAWYGASRRLEPLWRALYRVEPGLSLLPPPRRTGAWLIWRDLPFRVSRQVTEIRDWSRLLRPYSVPLAASLAEEVGRQAGLPDTDLPQLAEAAALAAALRAWSRQCPATAGQTFLASATSAPEEEVAVLARVADLFAHSPLVRRVLARLDQAELASAA